MKHAFFSALLLLAVSANAELTATCEPIDVNVEGKALTFVTSEDGKFNAVVAGEVYECVQIAVPLSSVRFIEGRKVESRQAGNWRVCGPVKYFNGAWTDYTAGFFANLDDIDYECL